ncbi:hypothetical protein N9D37_01160 [Erythrobacter sp.]|nr:hypothetical protein [Erythrobacter sp.]
MKRLTLLFSSVLFLSSPILAEDTKSERIPFNQLNCRTIDAVEGSEFETDRVTIILSVPFNITNSDRRLKFYRSMIAFGDNEAYQIVQPQITSDDMSDKNGRFGNLRERRDDDDIPTGFEADGVEYELQTVTGFEITQRTGENTFTINQDDPITVKLEAITDSNEREPPVWIGECIKTGLYSPS